jgi:uncharacterized protein YheU (UPF0270 family)
MIAFLYLRGGFWDILLGYSCVTGDLSSMKSGVQSIILFRGTPYQSNKRSLKIKSAGSHTNLRQGNWAKKFSPDKQSIGIERKSQLQSD